MSKLNKIFSKNIGFNIINYIYFNTKNYVERRNENEQKLKDINWINKFINSDSITFNLDSTTKIELYKDSILSRLIFEGFEVDEIAFLKKTLKPGDIFLDVGANIGVFSLIAANIVTESGKVICFEPSPVTYNRLVSNIKINNFTNIDAFNVGLSDKSDTLDLNISENGYDAWNTFAKVENEKFHKKIAIKVNTLDKALENIAKEKIRLVKLDVEGWEKFVLLGGKNFLINYSPILMVEFTETNTFDAGYFVQEIYDIIVEYGYLWYRFKDRILIPEKKQLHYPYDNLVAIKKQ